MTLKPAVGAEFSGSLAAGGLVEPTWESQGGGAGGSATVSGGALHVDGASAGTDATFAPGHSLEFDATFGAAPFQHAGFADNFNERLGDRSAPRTAPTCSSPGPTTARPDRHPDPGRSLLGSEHRYRIEWDTSEVRFYVDGNLVATHTITSRRRCVRRQRLQLRRRRLAVDWMRMSPYPASGSFDSHVLDAGEQAAGTP